MAHSHQRTLLAKMGFGDPDLRLPEHDVACQYLTSQEVFPRLFAAVTKSPLRASHYSWMRLRELDKWKVCPEYMVTKGTAQYKSTVGFVDALIDIRARGDWWDDHAVRDEGGSDKWIGGWKPFLSIRQEEHAAQFQLGLEVKITPETIAAILRQIGVYREFGCDQWIWLLATKFPITSGDAEELRRSNILHVRLGKQFEDYYDAMRDPRNNSTDANSIEI